jgi:hypothetical protein
MVDKTKRIEGKNKNLVEYRFMHVNTKGRISKKNNELIGIIEASDIIRKVMDTSHAKARLVAEFVKDHQKVFVFGNYWEPQILDDVIEEPGMFIIKGI